MNGFRLFGKPITPRHLAYLAGFVIWLALVFLLPPEWSRKVLILGIGLVVFRYYCWAADDLDSPGPGGFSRDLYNAQREARMRSTLDVLIGQVELEEEHKIARLVFRLPDEASTFTSEEWNKLRQRLERRLSSSKSSFGEDAEARAILTALCEHGNSAKLSNLERWVSTLTRLWASEVGEIARKAEASVIVLQARLNRETYGATLLRPAVRSDAPDELLRPAAGGVETDPAMLLRPTAKDTKT
jgi:hypothetical protein